MPAPLAVPHPLRALVDLLSGRRVPHPDEDWTAVIAAANAAWLGPALAAALARVPPASMPDDVRDYLDLLHGLDRERNIALRAQLFEAAGLLAGEGIRPILGKGAAFLFTAAEEEIGIRMMGDLDLTVAPDERRAAIRALARAGYCRWRAPNEDSDVLFRSRDAGPIELHTPTPGHPAYAALDRLATAPDVVERVGVRVLVPSPTARLLHLALHDEIRDGGLHRGSFDLRHLFDGARLLATGRVDAALIETARLRPHERRALSEWLLLVETLTGVGNPLAPPTRAVRRSVRIRLGQTGRGTVPSLLRFMRRGLWLAERIRRGEASLLDVFERLAPQTSQEDESGEVPIRGLGQGPRIG